MFSFEQLTKILASEPKYRLKQARQAIFSDFISNWDEATIFPVKLRALLNENCSLAIEAQVQTGQKGQVQKVLIKLADGALVEAVLMKHATGRRTVCVSSQVGCPLGCAFCATGAQGFTRNLTAEEIVTQILFFARQIKPEKITNVVFMGMGEPMLNFEAVWKAVEIINQDFGLASRHISISTAGIVEGIKKLATKTEQVNLAISLHAPTDNLRSQLMPINNQFPIKDVLSAVEKYIAKTNRKVMFEYVMIKGVNDSNRQAEELARLMNKPLYMVNLVVYNPTGTFKPSLASRIKGFKEILANAGVEVTQRHSFGGEISAACGQLAGRKK